MFDLPLSLSRRHRASIAARLVGALLVASTALGSAAAQSLSGPATAGDGDSLSVSGMAVRLFGIDAPELAQTCRKGGQAWACGEEARRQLQSLVDGQRVDCRGRGHDDYGRAVAICTVGGVELNRTMVGQGWALAFRKYSDSYVSDEQSAKASGRGIWSSTFDAPAAYRLAHPRRDDGPRAVDRHTPSRGVAVQRQYSSSGCDIKGNHSRRGEWIYHLPGMPYYAQTRAEEMFCSEAEAQAAGYRRARVRQ